MNKELVKLKMNMWKDSVPNSTEKPWWHSRKRKHLFRTKSEQIGRTTSFKKNNDQ